MYERLPPDDAIELIVRPDFKLPPVQPGEGMGESSAAAGVEGAPATGIVAAAPAIVDIVIPGALPASGVIVGGVMPGVIEAGVGVLGALAPAEFGFIAAGDPAIVLAGAVVGGIAALPAGAPGVAAVGGCVPTGSEFEPLPLQAAHARANPNPSVAPSHETRADCTWSSITPHL